MRRFGILLGIVNDEKPHALPNSRYLPVESQFEAYFSQAKNTKIAPHRYDGNETTAVQCQGGNPKDIECDVETGIVVSSCPECHRKAEWTEGGWDVIDWSSYILKWNNDQG